MKINRITTSFLIILIAMALILTGCSMHYTKDIVEDLQHAQLYESFDTVPLNLKAQSKCPYPPSIRIINDEMREDGIDMRPDSFHVSLPLNPKELTDGIVDYLGIGFKKSGIEVNEQSPKIIKVSLKDVKGERGVWAQGCKVDLGVDIPEMKYVNIYSARENSFTGPIAVTYAIHRITRQIIDDTTIQDYILCRDKYEFMNGQKEKNLTSKSLSHKLQELQTALDNGLITKEEYQLKRKELVEKY
jgi:hypothetical protein